MSDDFSKGNFGKLVETAQKLQDGMKSAQKELEDLRIVGEAGGGLVKITGNGRHDVVSVWFDPSVLSEEKTIIEDLTAAACNDLTRKIEKAYKSKVSGLATGFDFNKNFDLSSDDDDAGN